MFPSWYGKKYPNFSDFVGFASGLGSLVKEGNVPGALFVPSNVVCPGSPSMILLSDGFGPLERIWWMAHEVGHLVRHSGAPNSFRIHKVENQANQWAANALIPESSIRQYRNASVDAFIAALSKHYEDIPMWDCPQRNLAGYIARVRLQGLKEVA